MTRLDWILGTLRRPPRYLGTVSNLEHETLGHCFQVSRGYWATSLSAVSGLAAHQVQIEDLQGGRVTPCRVQVDERADLAILQIPMSEQERLAGSVAALATTDSVEPGTEVVITCLIDEEALWTHSPYVDVTGTWRGSTTRNGVLRLGERFDHNLLARMRGAPVRRRDDNVVVGIVSAPDAQREDSSSSVWVSSTEDLRAFSDGVIDQPLNIVPRSSRDIPSIAIALNIVAAGLILPVSDYLETESGRSLRWVRLVVVALVASSLAILGYVQLRRSVPVFTRIRWLRPFQPYVFTLGPFIVTLFLIWFGTQLMISIAPRPVTLYLLDQTEAVQRIEGDLDRALKDELETTDTEVKAALSPYGGGPPQAAVCQTFPSVPPFRVYDDFQEGLSEALGDLKPSGHASLEAAVIAALDELERQPGKKTLVIVTTGRDIQCDESRPSLYLTTRRDENVQIRVVDVRLEPVGINDDRRAFLQYLASALNASYRVGDDVASLREAVAPPTYRNPGVR